MNTDANKKVFLLKSFVGIYIFLLFSFGMNLQDNKKASVFLTEAFYLSKNHPFATAYLRRRYAANARASAPKIAAYVAGSGTTVVFV